MEPELLFFLGAGASVAAGVPDTFNLVNGFLEDLKMRQKDSELEHCKKILKILQGSELASDRRVDVELLLEALDQLENIDGCIPLKFFKVRDCILGDYIDSRSKGHLKSELEGFIKKTGLVSKDKIQYLKDLLLFIEEQPHRPLDIFSVNYDICIEQFCDTFEKEYVDGFYLKWEPGSLKRKDVDVRLHKIHGSITWYQTDRGSYVKLPIKSKKAEVELTTGEKATTLILYPMRKMEYTVPSMDLLMILKENLNRVKFAFVIGYSFRDNQIQQIFWNAAKKNKELILILISPSAHKVYEERLRKYDTGIPSDLEGRVICLPYKFEKVLPLLKNLYLKELKQVLNVERNLKNQENQGLAAHWEECLIPFINCEYIGKIEQILQKDAWETYGKGLHYNWQDVIMTAFKAFLTSLTSKNDLYKQEWLSKLNDSFSDIINATQVTFQLIPKEKRLFITPKFKLSRGDSLESKKYLDLLKTMLDECRFKMSMMVDEQRIKLEKAESKLLELIAYFEPFKDEKIAFSDYVHMREGKHPVLINQLKEAEEQRPSNKFSMILSKIEENELREVLGGAHLKFDKE